jgi:CHAD domain-containing protein
MKLPAAARQPASSGPATVTSAAEARADGAGGFDSSATAQDVALAELERLLGAWHGYAQGARLGVDPEQLHQLRITTRRIDATLALFQRQLSPALLRARKTTKSVLRLLGAARDLDVQLEELRGYCAQLPAAERAAAEPLRERLERERERARSRMLRGLEATPVRRWLETLSRAERAVHVQDELAIVVMPERVRRRFRKLRKAVERLRGKSSMDDYHQVRRRAKQLRYATECGAPYFGKPADELLRALRRMQDQLGAQQDAFMAQGWLATLAAEPEGLPAPTLFFMGRLAERHARITAEARRTLDRAWRRVRGKRWKALRSRLAELSESAAATPGVGAAPLAPLPDVAATTPSPELRTLKH